MRIILVTCEPGYPIAAYPCPDDRHPNAIERVKQKLYNYHREKMKAAFCVLHPGRSRDSVKSDDIPMVNTCLVDVSTDSERDAAVNFDENTKPAAIPGKGPLGLD